jgi:hypothetical protein
MAAVVIGGQWAVATSATTIADALALTTETTRTNYYMQRLSVKNANDATGYVYLGNSDVTNVPANAHVQLAPGESYDFYASGGWLVDISKVYIVGQSTGEDETVFINGMA